jgi:hypothetical protein
LNYCRALGNQPGSRLRAAQLADDRFLAEIAVGMEDARRNQAGEPHRPPLEHFSAEVEALYDVSDDIRTLINAMTQAGEPLPYRRRPATPSDRIAARQREIDRNRNREAIGGV